MTARQILLKIAAEIGSGADVGNLGLEDAQEHRQQEDKKDFSLSLDDAEHLDLQRWHLN